MEQGHHLASSAMARGESDRSSHAHAGGLISASSKRRIESAEAEARLQNPLRDTKTDLRRAIKGSSKSATARPAPTSHALSVNVSPQATKRSPSHDEDDTGTSAKKAKIEAHQATGATSSAAGKTSQGQQETAQNKPCKKQKLAERGTPLTSEERSKALQLIPLISEEFVAAPIRMFLVYEGISALIDIAILLGEETEAVEAPATFKATLFRMFRGMGRMKGIPTHQGQNANKRELSEAEYARKVALDVKPVLGWFKDEHNSNNIYYFGFGPKQAALPQNISIMHPDFAYDGYTNVHFKTLRAELQYFRMLVEKDAKDDSDPEEVFHIALKTAREKGGFTAANDTSIREVEPWCKRSYFGKSTKARDIAMVSAFAVSRLSGLNAPNTKREISQPQIPSAPFSRPILLEISSQTEDLHTAPMMDEMITNKPDIATSKANASVQTEIVVTNVAAACHHPSNLTEAWYLSIQRAIVSNRNPYVQRVERLPRTEQQNANELARSLLYYARTAKQHLEDSVSLTTMKKSILAMPPSAYNFCEAVIAGMQNDAVNISLAGRFWDAFRSIAQCNNREFIDIILARIDEADRGAIWANMGGDQLAPEGQVTPILVLLTEQLLGVEIFTTIFQGGQLIDTPIMSGISASSRNTTRVLLLPAIDPRILTNVNIVQEYKKRMHVKTDQEWTEVRSGRLESVDDATATSSAREHVLLSHFNVLTHSAVETANKPIRIQFYQSSQLTSPQTYDAWEDDYDTKPYKPAQPGEPQEKVAAKIQASGTKVTISRDWTHTEIINTSGLPFNDHALLQQGTEKTTIKFAHMFKLGEDPTRECIDTALGHVFSREDHPLSTYPVTNSKGTITYKEFKSLLWDAATRLEEAIDKHVSDSLGSEVDTTDMPTLAPRIMQDVAKLWKYSDDRNKPQERALKRMANCLDAVTVLNIALHYRSTATEPAPPRATTEPDSKPQVTAPITAPPRETSFIAPAPPTQPSTSAAWTIPKKHGSRSVIENQTEFALKTSSSHTSTNEWNDAVLDGYDRYPLPIEVFSEFTTCKTAWLRKSDKAFRNAGDVIRRFATHLSQNCRSHDLISSGETPFTSDDRMNANKLGQWMQNQAEKYKTHIQEPFFHYDPNYRLNGFNKSASTLQDSSIPHMPAMWIHVSEPFVRHFQAMSTSLHRPEDLASAINAYALLSKVYNRMLRNFKNKIRPLTANTVP